MASEATVEDAGSVDDQPVPLTERILFRSADLLVRAVTRPGDALCYVTFDSYTDHPGLDREGFGERHFAARDISAIHVISRDNRWYQHPELPEALAAVAAETAGRARIVAYGSSMGGFAALMYGSACGAHVGLALSPQYSLKPRTPPYDRRWAADVAHIRFQPFTAPPLPLQYVLYDPRDRLDRAHAELFAARSETILIGIPNAGHPVGSYVNETEMFEPLFTGVVDGTLMETAAAFEQELWRRRRMSGQYFFNIAVRTWQKRLSTSIAMARAASAARTDSAHYRSFLGFLLDKSGNHGEAAGHHHAAMALSGANIHTAINLAVHFSESGQHDEAARRIRNLDADYPNSHAVAVCARRIRRRRLKALILDPIFGLRRK